MLFPLSFLAVLTLFTFVVVACTPAPAPAVTPTPTATPDTQATVDAAVEVAVEATLPVSLRATLISVLGGPPEAVPTPTPKPSLPPAATLPPEPRTLTICVGAIPDTLYIHAGSMLAMNNVLEAVYDGPIDTNGFEYQPVILEKLPSLADGDAIIRPVLVVEGDWVVNDSGEVVQLAVGERVRPYGCNQTECAMTWDGGSLEMAQLSATFTLLEGTMWSDGEPLGTLDSVFSYNLARDCGSTWGEQYGPCGGLGQGGRDTLERTASYSALDERTTQWVGVPGFLDPYYATNFAHPLPWHRLHTYSPADLPDLEDTTRYPLGWGPYMIEEVNYESGGWRGYYIRLRKNPYYFRAAEGLPKFDVLVFRFIGENPARNVVDLLQGECDILEQNAHIDDWFEQLIELDAEGELQLHTVSGTVWEHADFNITPVDEIVNTGAFAGWDLDGNGLGPFGDVRLRQAIALCMDRQRVVNEYFYLGRAMILDSYLSPFHPLFNSDVTRYNYDPETAQVLLDEIGWVDADGDGVRQAHDVVGVPDGTPLEFSFETTSATLRQQATLILAESLAECGIKVNLAHNPAADWFADGPDGRLFGRRFDLGQFAWLSDTVPDCQNWLSEYIPGDPDVLDVNGNPIHPYGWIPGELRLPVNAAGYRDAEFDAACKAARSYLPGQPEYVEYHLKAQEIFAADLPVIPLYMRLKITAARKDMCGYWMDPTADSDTWNIEAYDYGSGCR